MMNRFVKQVGGSNIRVRLPIRYYSNIANTNANANTNTSESSANSSELEDMITTREKSIAEAMEREEQEQKKLKELLEFKYQSKELISKLNKIPSELIHERLNNLQNQLSKLDSGKVKQLDEELTDYMINHLKLPNHEVSDRPWHEIKNVKRLINPLDNNNNNNNNDNTNSNDNGNNSSYKITSNSILNKHPYLKPTSDYHPFSEQELYLRQLNHSRQSGNLGSKIKNIYNIKKLIVKPINLNEITLSKLMAAGCHLGHSKSNWRPSTQPFIYGEYDGIHLIDLNETISALKRSIKIIKGVASKGGIILYVGTTKNEEINRSLQEAAKRSNGYYISKKWIAGTITNFTQVISKSEDKRLEIDMLDLPTGRNLNPIESKQLIKPDLVVILNPVENRNCIEECLKSRIPTIGLCDTDMEPSLMTYPIPCNDDSIRSITLMLGLLSKAANEGISERISDVKLYKGRL